MVPLRIMIFDYYDISVSPEKNVELQVAYRTHMGQLKKHKRSTEGLGLIPPTDGSFCAASLLGNWENEEIELDDFLALSALRFCGFVSEHRNHLRHVFFL